MPGRGRCAVRPGWAGPFYFGQFLVGWHWIAYAFLIYPGATEWELPFAPLLPAGVALFGALACGLAIFSGGRGLAAFHLCLRGGAVGMAAGASFHRLSLEPVRLWLGRVAGADAIGQLDGAYGLSFLTILLALPWRNWHAHAGARLWHCWRYSLCCGVMACTAWTPHPQPKCRV